MGSYLDLNEQKFGRLTCIKDAGRNKWKNVIWLCVCDCGSQINVVARDLVGGHTKSCGCLQREKAAQTIPRFRPDTTKHGQRHSRLYQTWLNMKARCLNPNNTAYKNYGGRGIKVCPEWLEFEPFYRWAKATGYQDSLTIERIEVNGNYKPSNCKWVPKKQQPNNSRSNILITYKGETKNLQQWANQVGMHRSTLRSRIKAGWAIEQALNKPVQGAKR